MSFLHSRFLGGILLVAGTAIGAGMLGLPVDSAPLGFHYAALLLIVSWVFMYLTSLLVLEVNLSFKSGISYITMARETLGPVGGYLNWLFFLGLLYSLLAAYVAGGGDLISDLLRPIMSPLHAERMGPFIWVVGFATIVFFGMSVADRINRVFMFFLMGAYIFLVAVAVPNVSVGNISVGQPSYVFAALPIVFASLAFHIIIPSLSEYLQYDAPRLKRILLCGSLLALGVYLLWETVIFGLIPLDGEAGLIAILKSGKIVSQLTASLQQLVPNLWVALALRYFIFFAIATSFLGVAYGLFDLLRDGFRVHGRPLGRALTLLLTFIPPLMYAELYPQGFIFALSYAGIFVAIIHGIIPVLMVWRHRRLHPTYTGYRVAGGVPLLMVTAGFFLLVIYSFIAVDLGWLPSIK